MDGRTTLLYLSILIILIVTSFLISCSKSRFLKIALVVFTVAILSLLSGLRSYYVGSDSYSYYQEYILGNNGTIKFEPLFEWLMLILFRFTNSYTIFFLVVAFLTNGLIITRLWSLKKHYPFSCSVIIYYCFLYFRTFSGLRQLLAVAIIFWGTKYLFCKKPQWIKLLLIAIVAFLIHYSSLASSLLLIPFFIKKSKNSLITALKILFLLAVPFAIKYVYNFVFDNYEGTLSAESSAFKIGFMLPLRIFVLFLIWFQYARKNNDSYLCECTKNNLHIPIKIVCFYELLSIALSSMDYFWPSIGRLSWYFALFTPVLYSAVLSKKKIGDGMGVIISSAVVLITMYYFWGFLNSTSTNIVPYTFFWEV